jgi:replicative DNA helicase
MLGGQVYNVVAYTGLGKTTFAGACAAHASEQGESIYALYEMTPGLVLARIAAPRLRVASNEIVRGNVDRRRVLAAVPPGLRLMDRPSLSDLEFRAREVAQRTGRAPLLVVDYLSKLADVYMATMARPDPRLAMTATSDRLIRMADVTKSPILVVTASSRASGQRARDARSQSPSSLVDSAKESGAVEFDSAGLLVLSIGDEQDDDGSLIATVTVAKSRFGATRHLDFRFTGACGEWRDLGPVTRRSTPVAAKRSDGLDVKVVAVLESLKTADAPQSFRGIRERDRKRLVRGRDADIRAAINRAIEDGSVVRITDAGTERYDLAERGRP